MKLILLISGLYFGSVAFSCSQDNDAPETVSDSSLIIKLKNCSNKRFGSQTVTVCLDSVLVDSRCPANVTCVWEGTVIAKFSFSNNSSVLPVILSTLKIGSYAPDTVLSGYKIRFVDLSPYPGTNTPSAPVNAEVQITKQ